MELGIVGLGRMGFGMTVRLLEGGHRVVAFNRSEGPRLRIAKHGADTVPSLEELVDRLAAPRIVWLMLPAGDVTETHLTKLADLLLPGDMMVDGANSYYKDTIRRATLFCAKGLDFVDVGVSGGVWGLLEGYSMMVGGEAQAVERLCPVLETLALGPALGWGHVGTHGAGHFAKMVHNGIEYGMMEAYAEGFALLHAKTEFSLDLNQIARIWQHGSVIRSWLLDLIERSLAQDPTLDKVVGQVPDSGEGRWAVLEGLEQNVSLPVITLSLLRRIRSREEAPFGDKLLAVLREQFGGHEVQRRE